MRHLIIDTSFLIYRSYFAYPHLNTGDKPSGAFFGFVKTLLSLQKEFKPDKIFFALDSKEKTWRHKEYPEYKAGRAEMEDSMRQQIPIIVEWIKNVANGCIDYPGYEADDIINTYIVRNQNEKDEFLVFSSDQDLYQILVIPGVSFIRTTKGTRGFSLFGLSDFYEKFGVNPIQWVDYKALVGDNSDNLPGVTGIGPKTAILLLQKGGDIASILNYFGLEIGDFVETGFDFDSIYFSTDKINKIIEKIKVDKQKVVRAYRLARLNNVDFAKVDDIFFDWSKGLNMFEEYKFYSLIREISGEQKTPRIIEEQDSLF